MHRLSQFAGAGDGDDGGLLRLLVALAQFFAFGAVAHQHIDAGQQVFCLEGFDQIVISADLVALQAFPERAVGGEEDHRDILGLRQTAQSVADLIAVDARHLHIEQDEIRLLLLGDRDARLAVIRRSGRQPACRQGLADQFLDESVVVDDEDIDLV